MGHLSVQTVPRHASWLLVGPPAATSLAPQQDITVTFPNSTSVVVPAGVPAQLPGGGTAWDRTIAVVVGYVVPGSGTLLACLESQLAGLSGDYAPLVAVLSDAVEVYQPQQPSGAAIKAGAWSGGAFIGVGRSVSGAGSYGALDTKSMSGAGSVSGLTFNIPPGDGTGGHPCTRTSLFVKVPSAPAGDTTLFDWNGGASGYYRLKVTSALALVLEFRTPGGATGSLDALGSAIATSTWYWVTCDFANGGGGNQTALDAQVTPGGAQRYSGSIPFPPSPVSYTAAFGVGKSLSSAYADFPNTAGWELSKIVIDQIGSNTVVGQPRATLTADLGAGAAYAEYMCAQAIGATATLNDTSGNAFHLSGTMTIQSDGPYA